MTITLNIIGAGHVGQTLGHLWAKAQTLKIQQVLNRSSASTHGALTFIGAGLEASDITALGPASLWLIATPDDQIAATCNALSAAGKFSSASIVFHCSGALSSAALASACDHGAAVASVHPIRSFADPVKVAADFTGTWCGVEGEQRALDLLTPLFSAIGARFVPIKAEHKTLYHAAAVFACNYLVTLQDIALAAYAEAGIPPDVGARLLEPLVRETVDNVFAKGPALALTGPVARGDHATVGRQQLAVSRWNGEYGDLYAQFAKLTADLAAKRK